MTKKPGAVLAALMLSQLTINECRTRSFAATGGPPKAAPVAAAKATQAKATKAKDGQQLQGAAAALRQSAPIRAPKDAPKTTSGSDLMALRRDIRAFGRKSETMEAGAAVNGWLDLVDRQGKLAPSRTDATMMGTISFSEIVAILPPPATWDALARAIARREPWKPKKPARDVALLLFAHALKGDEAAIWKDEALLRTRLTDEGLVDGGGRVLGQLRESLSLIAERKGAKGKTTHTVSPAKPHTVMLPDLVTQQGYAKATFQIRQTLLTQNAQIDVPLGHETRRLAARLALQSVKQLKAPQWILAQSPNETALFEALTKRFPVVPARTPLARTLQQSRQRAEMYYLVGLIASNRTPEAVKLAVRLGRSGNSMSPEVIESLSNSGDVRALNNFLHDLLTRDPNLPYWSQYISTAARTGATRPMLALVRANSSRKGMSPERMLQIRVGLYKALLAADRVDEGVAVLRQLMAAKARPNRRYDEDSRLALASQLASIGHITGRRDWEDEGVRVVQAELAKPNDNYGYGMYGPGVLIRLGRPAAAEKILISKLKQSRAQSAAMQEAMGPAGAMSYLVNDGDAAGALVGLAGLYSRSGRHRDVLMLLNDANGWGVKDLSENYWTPDEMGTPLGYAAAAALAATGRGDEAAPILKALINVNGGYDPAYKLLVTLRGKACIPFLDEVYSRNRFEERPLIWKARVLQQGGDLPAAEKTARAAIAVDPSDGEQGKGDRMRAYAVLADIRAAQGDAAQAKLFRGAVKAIRLSEDADDVYAAGLLLRGIRQYKHALTWFADAYCIQSRLAIQLSELGKTEEAAAHYRRAYELMPDSFGRMESHCLGCERAFKGARAETTAERIFRGFLEKQPNKPQLHYLLGYLREEQSRYNAALPLFRRAVQLDPDYLNAWKHLQSLSAYMKLSRTDRDAAAYNLLRLDPLGRNVRANLSRVSNLRQLWTAVEKAERMSPPAPPEKLLPLTASIPVAEKAEEEMKKQLAEYGVSNQDEYMEMMLSSRFDYHDDDDSEYGGDMGFSRPGLARKPGRTLAAHAAVRSLTTIIDMKSYGFLMGMGRY